MAENGGKKYQKKPELSRRIGELQGDAPGTCCAPDELWLPGQSSCGIYVCQALIVYTLLEARSLPNESDCPMLSLDSAAPVVLSTLMNLLLVIALTRQIAELRGGSVDFTVENLHDVTVTVRLPIDRGSEVDHAV